MKLCRCCDYTKNKNGICDTCQMLDEMDKENEKKAAAKGDEDKATVTKVMKGYDIDSLTSMSPHWWMNKMETVARAKDEEFKQLLIKISENWLDGNFEPILHKDMVKAIIKELGRGENEGKG